MKYAAVNAKIKAMRGRLLTLRDYEDLCRGGDFSTGGGFPPGAGVPADANSPALQKDFAKIAPYLPDKPTRDFMKKFACQNQLVANPYQLVSQVFSKTFAHAVVPDKSSRESLARVFGAETDLRNILWVHRLKKFHNIHGDAVFAFLAPRSFRLPPSELAKLAHAKDFREFFRAVANGPYGGVLPDLVRGEQHLSRAVRAAFLAEARRENLAVVCGYLHARKLEEKNLRIIVEGKKQKLGAEEILNLLH